MTCPPRRPVVAFVDDEPLVLNGLRRLLRGHSGQWDMRFYPSAEGFWQHGRENWPEVAVLDLNMPGWSGLDLARALRGAGAETRCIMLTGNAGLSDAMAFINEAAVFRYYMKPCEPEVLAEAVEAALADIRQARETTERRAGSSPADALTDLLAIGTVVLDRDLRVVFANKAAIRQLADGRAVTTDSANRLRAATSSANRVLERAVQEAVDLGRSTVFALEAPDDGHSLHVTVSATGDADGRQATLFINDPARASYPPAETLRHLFGLTGSESRLVEQLARGQSLEEAAEANGLRVGSARTYLKAVFQKMGVSRQAELVQKALTASTAIVAADDG